VRAFVPTRYGPNERWIHALFPTKICYTRTHQPQQIDEEHWLVYVPNPNPCLAAGHSRASANAFWGASGNMRRANFPVETTLFTGVSLSGFPAVNQPARFRCGEQTCLKCCV